MGAEQISSQEARRAQLASQGLLGRRPAGGPASVLEITRGVQIDTISVLARAHELVALARLGAVSRERVEAAYWAGPPYSAFEYWYHAACILPIEEWPYFEFKRGRIRARGYRWHQADDLETSCKVVLAQLRERGPLTAKELGGAKRGGPWWDWSETKIAAEWLLDVGEVVCTSRRNFQRVYDLPERAIPSGLLEPVEDEEAALAHLAQRALGALGVATAQDVAGYIGVKQAEAARALAGLGAERVSVQGWPGAAYLAPGALELPGVAGRARVRARLLSPFDSLVCDRQRLERVFGFRHRLEAYVPRHKRLDGYYSMPVLAADRLVARVDPARADGALVARSVRLEPDLPEAKAVRAVAQALREAARWTASERVVVEKVSPSAARQRLVSLLSRA